MTEDLSSLKEAAEALAGRELDVETTADGKHIVLFLDFSLPPPPKGDSPEEAYLGFAGWLKEHQVQRGLVDGASEVENK